MSLTVNTDTYDVRSIGNNSAVYAGPNHSVSAKDLLTLSFTPAKPTTTYRGNGRNFVKLERTLTLDDGSKAQAIVTINYQVPVGSALADVQALSDDLGALLSSASIDDIVYKQDIMW